MLSVNNVFLNLEFKKSSDGLRLSVASSYYLATKGSVMVNFKVLIAMELKFADLFNV
jgi:hypothetical protein